MSGKPSAASAASEERFDPKHTLVVVFSRRGENYAPGGTEVLAVGHTEFLTQGTAEHFGMNLFEVRTVDPYPERGPAVTGVDAESWAPEVEAGAGRFICLEAQKPARCGFDRSSGGFPLVGFGRIRGGTIGSRRSRRLAGPE